MESFESQFLGHQFYSDNAVKHMYENYIESGRHQSYVPTKSITHFDEQTSYKLAFDKIQSLHAKLSSEASESSCHLYAWKLYRSFDPKRFVK